MAMKNDPVAIALGFFAESATHDRKASVAKLRACFAVSTAIVALQSETRMVDGKPLPMLAGLDTWAEKPGMWRDVASLLLGKERVEANNAARKVLAAMKGKAKNKPSPVQVQDARMVRDAWDRDCGNMLDGIKAHIARCKLFAKHGVDWTDDGSKREDAFTMPVAWFLDDDAADVQPDTVLSQRTVPSNTKGRMWKDARRLVPFKYLPKDKAEDWNKAIAADMSKDVLQSLLADVTGGATFDSLLKAVAIRAKREGAEGDDSKPVAVGDAADSLAKQFNKAVEGELPEAVKMNEDERSAVGDAIYAMLGNLARHEPDYLRGVLTDLLHDEVAGDKVRGILASVLNVAAREAGQADKAA